MAVVLLESTEMGRAPKEFYAVAKAPGLLAGMSYPSGDKWQSLHVSGYRHVVCLTDDRPSYDPAPLVVLYSARLQDLAGERMPDKPDHEESCIREAVALVVQRLRAGEGVAIHCAGGTGRTGTVIACSLKALGCQQESILDQMNSVNAARTRYAGWKGWPESQWQRKLFDRF